MPLKLALYATTSCSKTTILLKVVLPLKFHLMGYSFCLPIKDLVFRFGGYVCCPRFCRIPSTQYLPFLSFDHRAHDLGFSIMFIVIQIFSVCSIFVPPLFLLLHSLASVRSSVTVALQLILAHLHPESIVYNSISVFVLQGLRMYFLGEFETRKKSCLRCFDVGRISSPSFRAPGLPPTAPIAPIAPTAPIMRLKRPKQMS